MQHVVVYDSQTSSLQDPGQALFQFPCIFFQAQMFTYSQMSWFLHVVAGRAVECAQTLAQASLHPVCIVTGGFQRFSALYPFLRTEKILYTVTVTQHLGFHTLIITPVTCIFVLQVDETTNPKMQHTQLIPTGLQINHFIYFWIISGAGKHEDISSGGHSRTAVHGQPRTKHGLWDPQGPENQCCSLHLRD